MRLLALLLLIGTAHAQGLTTSPPGVSGGGKVLASYPLTTSGPLIVEDQNTVAHVYWNGTALVDTKGNAWTMNGTVPQVTANPFTTTRYGAGPFSSANYYSLGTGADVLDFAGGDYSCTAVFNPGPVAAANQLLMENWAGSVGWLAWVNATTGVVKVYSNGTNTSTTNAVVSGGPNVATWGRASGTHYAKLNLGTTASAVAAYTAPAGSAATIGYGPGTTVGDTGTIYEAMCSSSPFVEATAVAIQQKVLGHFDGSSALAVTRATNATYEKGGTIWTVPPGVARITSEGLLVEGARTNYALNSDAMSVSTSANTGWLTTNATVATVAGAPIGTWAEVTSTTSAGQFYAAPTSAPAGGTTTYVGSVWMAKASGTGYAAIQVGHASLTSTACSCVRSDGGTCTASKVVSDRYCRAEVSDLGTTPVRVSVMTTMSGTSTEPVIVFKPGQDGVATGTTRFAAADLQVGTYPTSHITTVGTAVARNADQVSATVPAVSGINWCLATTATRGPNAWGGTNLLWSLGTTGTLDLASTFTVTDGAAGTKTVATTGTPATGSHRIVACDKAGALSLALDGTPYTTNAGAGTGIIGGTVTTLYFGAAASTLYGGVYLKGLKLCSKISSVKDCR